MTNCLSCAAEIEDGRALCDRCVDEKVTPAAMGLMKHFEWAFEKIVGENKEGK